MATLFRPRDNIEILDAAFRLYRRHFAKLFGLSLAVGLPSTVWLFRVDEVSFRANPFTLFAPSLVVFVESWLVKAAYAEILLTNELNLGKALRRFLRNLHWLVAMGLLFFLGTAVASLALVVPGVWVYLRWYFYDQIILTEESSKPLRRSADLTEGMRGSLGYLLTGSVALTILLGNGLTLAEILPRMSYYAHLAGWISFALVVPITAGVEALAYANLRSRREGYDLVLRSEALDAAVASSA